MNNLDKYFNMLEDDEKYDVESNDFYNCYNCHGIDIINEENYLICKSCGHMRHNMEMVDEYQKINLYDTRNLYKRINHWKEFLKCFQSMESTIIKDNIINIFKNDSIYLDNKDNLEKIHIKKIIKKHKITYFNKHINKIYYILTGKKITIERDIRDKLIIDFQFLQYPYRIYKGEDRKNFFNYYYVLYKLLELNKQYHLLKHIPLMNEKILTQHDDLFSKICNFNGWVFNKTI